MITRLRIGKKRLFSRWFLPLFHNLIVAFRTYKNAVFLVKSSPLFSGNFLYRNPFVFFIVGIHLFATFITPNNRRVTLSIGALPKISILDRMVIEMLGHSTDTSYTGWLPSKCNPNDSCYFARGKWTGLMINYRPYSLPPLPFHALDFTLKSTLFIENDFKQAQSLVEEYYTEKVAVNSNGTVPTMEMFSKSYRLKDKMRKSKVALLPVAVAKINKYITEVK